MMVYTAPAYLPYLNFVEAIFSVICLLATIAMMGNLLYRARFDRGALRSKTVPPMMYVYLATHVIFAALTLPFLVYVIAWWRPPRAREKSTAELAYATAKLAGSANHSSAHDLITHPYNPYDPYAVYWLELNLAMYVCMGSIPLAFLTLDRCLIIGLADGYRLSDIHRLRKRLAAMAVVTILGIYALLVALYLWELPLQLDKVKGCMDVPCLQLKTLGLPVVVGKDVFETVGLLLCLYFFRLLRKKREEGSTVATKVKNRLVATLLVIELLFGVLPSYTATLFSFVFHQPITNYTGRYAGTFMTVDALCCALYYSRLMLRPGWWRVARENEKSSMSRRGTLWTTTTTRGTMMRHSSTPTIPPSSIREGKASMAAASPIGGEQRGVVATTVRSEEEDSL